MHKTTFVAPTEICRRDTVSQGPHAATPTSTSALPGAASGAGAEVPSLAEGDMLQPRLCRLHLLREGDSRVLSILDP